MSFAFYLMAPVCRLLEEHLYFSTEFPNIVCSDPNDKNKLFILVSTLPTLVSSQQKVLNMFVKILRE